LDIRKNSYFCPGIAGVAQLVEHDLAKVGVAGSSPVSRSNKAARIYRGGFIICKNQQHACIPEEITNNKEAPRKRRLCLKAALIGSAPTEGLNNPILTGLLTHELSDVNKYHLKFIWNDSK
jgi:hypothetical protein